MSTYTLRIAINGSETDETIEADSVAWDCKIGEIQTTEGGGSFLREANQAAASFTAMIPITLAPRVRTVTIAVQGPYNSSAPAWFTSAGGGDYYRVIFHGNITSWQGVTVGQSMVRFDAISQMQGLFERRTHTAAALNVGPRGLANQIESDEGLTIPNNTMIPDAADPGARNLDRPKQKANSNGDWLRINMAGTGMSIVADWDGPITNPTMNWRTDYQWFTGGYFAVTVAHRPWIYLYADVGIVPNDFIAKLEVNGTQGNTIDHAGYVRYPTMRTSQGGYRPSTRIIDIENGTRYWGTAQLGSASERRQVGDTQLAIPTWIDTAAECEDAALYLMRRKGAATYPKMYRVGWYPDLVLSDYDTVVSTSSAEDHAMEHATVMLGDQMQARDNFDDTASGGGPHGFGAWPASCPVNSPTYDDLYAMWQVILTSDGEESASVTSNYTIRTINRAWTPQAGWYIECALEPDNTVDAVGFDVDHGTFA